jgi:hypothetical protein
MKKMRKWDVTGLSLGFGEKEVVFERYGHVPKKWLMQHKKEKGWEDVDENETVDTMAILVFKKGKDKDNPDGSVLFIEEIAEGKRPYEEVHWEKQDGRWLGIGEVENQLENQIARNFAENMRRRGMLWATKKLFQSRSDEVQRNLIKEVKDGQVLKIDPNGEISQIDMTTHSLGEIENAIKDIEQNSNQKSFTFEVATGESLPSGTPFRLGVVLANSVNSHFGLKRENISLFMVRAIENQVYPEFKKKSNIKKNVTLFEGEEGVEKIKKALINNTVNVNVRNQILKGVIPVVALDRS